MTTAIALYSEDPAIVSRSFLAHKDRWSGEKRRDVAMQALIELLSGLIALLAAAALAQFGVDMTPRVSTEREIHRVQSCPPAPSDSVDVKSPERRC
jgi:hypothetical protein